MNYVEVINNYKDDIKDMDTLKSFIDFCLKSLKLKNVLFNVIG